MVLTVVSLTAGNRALPTMMYRLISSIVFYIILYMQPTNVDYGLGNFRSHRAPETLSLSAASSFLKHSFQLDDHRSYHLSLLVERVRSHARYLLVGDLSPLLSRRCWHFAGTSNRFQAAWSHVLRKLIAERWRKLNGVNQKCVQMSTTLPNSAEFTTNRLRMSFHIGIFLGKRNFPFFESPFVGIFLHFTCSIWTKMMSKNFCN